MAGFGVKKAKVFGDGVVRDRVVGGMDVGEDVEGASVAGVCTKEASVLEAGMVRGIIGGASVVVACVEGAGLAAVFLQ